MPTDDSQKRSSVYLFFWSKDPSRKLSFGHVALSKFKKSELETRSSFAKDVEAVRLGYFSVWPGEILRKGCYGQRNDAKACGNNTEAHYHNYEQDTDVGGRQFQEVELQLHEHTLAAVNHYFSSAPQQPTWLLDFFSPIKSVNSASCCSTGALGILIDAIKAGGEDKEIKKMLENRLSGSKVLKYGIMISLGVLGMNEMMKLPACPAWKLTIRSITLLASIRFTINLFLPVIIVSPEQLKIMVEKIHAHQSIATLRK